MSRPPTYPFVPKSNRRLSPGQFWGIQLSNGCFAAGRVIQVNPKDRSSFLVGLMDWMGPNPPTSDDLAGRRTLDQGSAGYLTIVDTGPAILGERPLELDGIEPDLMLSQGGWPGAWITRGFDWVRPATELEWASLPVHGGWGLQVVRVLAEKYLVRREPRRLNRPEVDAWLRSRGGGLS